MKKIRVSCAQRNEVLAQKLEDFKKRLNQKSVPRKTVEVTREKKYSAKTTEEQSVNKKVPEPQAVQRRKIETLPWLEDRARENVRQWGVRSKIDVEKIQALAAKLKLKILKKR